MKSFKEYLSEGNFLKSFKAGEKSGRKLTKTAGSAIGSAIKTTANVAKAGVQGALNVHKAAQKSNVAQPTKPHTRHAQYQQKVQQGKQQRRVASLMKRKNKNITL